MGAFLTRLIARFRRHDRGALDDEIRMHLDLLAAEYARRGMTSEEAVFAARRAFGGVEQMKERHRDARGWRWLDDLVHDVRLRADSLRHRLTPSAGSS